MTQHEKIIDYMKKNKSITPMEAFNHLGCTKLSTRVGELKKAGFNIESEMEKATDRYGMPIRYKRYWLIED